MLISYVFFNSSISPVSYPVDSGATCKDHSHSSQSLANQRQFSFKFACFIVFLFYVA